MKLFSGQSRSDISGKLSSSLTSIGQSDDQLNRSAGIVSKVNTTLQKQLELSTVQIQELEVKGVDAMWGQWYFYARCLK